MKQSVDSKNGSKTVETTTSGFEELPQSVQFVVLSLGVVLFFILLNLVQEAIVSNPEFNYGVVLGWAEVLGVTICSFIERQCTAKEKERVAPLSSYPPLTFLLMTSTSLSCLSLNYINFPTKVVFRSCKLIPTMIVASLVHGKAYSSLEYVCAASICTGLILFGAADWKLSPSFHPVGLILVTISVCADAILPNAQERVFGLGASRLEVTLYSNFFTLVAMTVMTLASGDLIGALRMISKDRVVTIYFAMYTFIAYLAISFHMTVVKRFGGVAAVMVATFRKAMSLFLSFVIFPKAFSWFYPVGSALALGGLLASSLIKVRKNNRTDVKMIQPEDDELTVLMKDTDSDGTSSLPENESDCESTPCTNIANERPYPSQ